MLARARRRADDADADVSLDVADVENLPYGVDQFDTAMATCVFCSVTDPVRGLACGSSPV
jgi:ubiquinone/menaquinone biosynthesis C-methylase UbiE